MTGFIEHEGNLETMTNVPSNPPERNPSPCRKCGKTIYWHRAQSGKNYPCDSPTDRRAFHKCEALPADTPAKPIIPDYFLGTVEERIAALEKQIAQLTRMVQELGARQPIGDEDVGF